MSLLVVERLSINAGDKLLVTTLSFTLAQGERLGLIGESGSGKSLTALAATGLLPAGITASGSIRLKGREVIGTADRELDSLRGTAVAIVFQEPLTALDPLMRVGRQVAVPLVRRARRDGKSLSRKALEAALFSALTEVALPDPRGIARAYPHELSGGQRQRIAIAMALACRPNLLIADEPTTALDVTTQAEILALIDRLVHEKNMALLFISHDLPVVANTVSNIVVLRHGEVVETGRVADIFARPRHNYTKSLLAGAQRFNTALEGKK